MIISSLKKIWTKSIARQLMFGIALVHAVLMTIFVVDLVQREKAFLVNLSREQAIGLAETLATNGTSWVLSQDFIGMEEIINSQSGFPGLKYAMFLDTKGKVLAYTDLDQVGKYIDDEISRSLFTAKPETYALIDHSGFIDIATPILAHNQQIGWARVGISRIGITENINHVTKNGLVYTIAAILIGTLFAWFMGRGLTMGLRQLSQATHGIIKGDHGVRCELNRHDELGVLAHDFNVMLTIIDDKEKALAENLALLNALLDSVPDLVFYKDLQGRYLGCNAAFEGLVGVTEAEVVGKTDYDFFPQNEADFLKDKDLQMLEDEKPQHNEEWVEYADGRRVLFDTLKIPFYTSQGECIGMIGISRDMTLVKEQERQLRRSRKMDALGKLTGGVAHDYNNMLGIILGYAELLKDGVAEQPSLVEYANNILVAGKRGASLTRKLLTFSKSNPENVKTVDLNRVIRESQQMIEKAITVSIKVDFNLQDNLWPVLLDVGDFDNALINLCINAKHAMDEGGLLQIRTENQYISKGEAIFLSITSGKYVVVTITDSGIGMSHETMGQIFDPFFSTKGEMGTGLGLSQVYGFVKRSNGSIQVKSEPGEGATFSLYFPENGGRIEDAEVKVATVFPGNKGDSVILVVDDEEQLCLLTGKTLEKQGFNVLTATSGREAELILQNREVSLLITDIIMPEMNGHELAVRAKEQQPGIKILFVSGYSEETGDTSIYRIQKPVQAEELIRQVIKVLAS
jgi:PAS domain S-box-containing protein